MSKKDDFAIIHGTNSRISATISHGPEVGDALGKTASDIASELHNLAQETKDALSALGGRETEQEQYDDLDGGNF